MITFIVATKENGYLHALSQAALVYTISEGCAFGRIPNCNCDPVTDIYDERVCKTSLNIGYQFATDFFSTKYNGKQFEKYSKKKKERLMIQSHNEKEGRKVRNIYILACHKP